jgi:hypothetical protein
MKASKFSEAQIAFVLKQAEDGSAVATVTLRDEAAASARGREQQAETDCRRPVFGQGHASGCALKKALRPGRKRELVDKVRSDWKVSIRRACSTLRIDRVRKTIQ